MLLLLLMVRWIVLVLLRWLRQLGLKMLHVAKLYETIFRYVWR